jgi:hypothetical protein
VSGAVGATVLTMVHQIGVGTLPDAPRMDVVGMRALGRLVPSAWTQDPDRLYRLTMVGDLVSNSIYYAGVAGRTPSETWSRGLLLGTAAGVGALIVPQRVGLGDPPHSESRRNQILTVAWYLLGGLAAAAVANAWTGQRTTGRAGRRATLRERNVEAVNQYLRQHFPDARIGSSTDGLTANEVFTIQDQGATRFVELTKRWLEGNHAGVPIAAAVRDWELAGVVKALKPNSTLRVATTGFERVG